MGKIINSTQQKILDLVSQDEVLTKKYYFGGGTALAEFYLQHRFSEDLDFFSEKEVDVAELNGWLIKNKKQIGFKKIDYQTSFNRNLFFLKFEKKYVLKMEFTYYPFARLETGLTYKKLQVDSLKDIAVNKVFTISQKPRARDYFDLWFILKKNNWDIKDLRKWARTKFDFVVDPVQLAVNLEKIETLVDDPILEKKVKKNELVAYFKNMAKSLAVLIF